MISRDDVETQLNEIRASISTNRGCSSNIVGLLEHLLSVKSHQLVHSVYPSRISRIVSRKQQEKPAVAEFEQLKVRARTPSQLTATQKRKFSTEVVNETLKSLTVIIRLRSATSNGSVDERQDAPAWGSSNELSLDCTSIRNLAICAIAAFNCLQSFNSSRQTEPDYRIESGISVLISKLIALDFLDLATIEIQILLHRICQAEKASPATNARQASKQALVEWLRIEETPTDREGLDLVITAQIQILKVLARNGGIEQSAALVQLEPDLIGNPISLIKKAQNLDYFSSEQASRHYKTLARCLSTFIPNDGTAKQSNLCYGSRAALTIFRYRALILRVQWESRICAKVELDLNHDLLQPLTSNIRCFLKDCQKPTEVDFETISNTSNKLISSCSSDLSSSTRSDMERNMAQVHYALANLAESIGNNKQLARQLQRATELNVSPKTSSQKCIMLCNICISEVHSATSVSRAFYTHLQELSRILESASEGTPSELDEILVLASTVRRLVYQLARKDALSTKNDDSFPVRHEAHTRLITSVAAYVVHYLGTPLESSYSESTMARFAQRAKMVNRVARATIDGVTLLACARTNGTDEAQNRCQQGLKDCVTLLTRLQQAVTANLLECLDSRLYDVYHALSNAITIFFGRLSVTNRRHEKSIALLQSSVELLDDRPDAEKRRGRYTEKLEKLACAQELIGETGLAAQLLETAVVTLVQDESLLKSAELGLLSLCDNLQAHSEELARLKSVLLLYTRIMERQKRSSWFTILERLERRIDDPIRGFIFELQLDQALDLLKVKRVQPRSLTSDAFACLHDVYDSRIYPVRHLRVVVNLMQAMQLIPELYDTGDYLRCRQILLAFEIHSLAKDEHLAEVASILLSSGQISSVVLSENVELELIRSTLESLAQVIRDRHLATLKVQTSSFSSHIVQLRSLADHLLIHRLDPERSRCLHILTMLCAEDSEKTQLFLARCDHALQELQLGWLTRAGMILQDLGSPATSELSDAFSCIYSHCIHALYFEMLKTPDKAYHHLEAAQKLLSEVGVLKGAEQRSWCDRSATLLASMRLCTIASEVHFSYCNAALSLFYARANATFAQRAWMLWSKRYSFEMLPGTSLENEYPPAGDVDNVVEHKSSSSGVQKREQAKLAPLRPMASSLMAALSTFSQRLADAGHLTEAQRYLQRAQRIADSLNSDRWDHFLEIQNSSYMMLKGKHQDAIYCLKSVLEAKALSTDIISTQANLELCAAFMQSGNIEGAARAVDDAGMGIERPSITCIDLNHPSTLDTTTLAMKKLTVEVEQLSMIRSSKKPHHSTTLSTTKTRSVVHASPNRLYGGGIEQDQNLLLQMLQLKHVHMKASLALLRNEHTQAQELLEMTKHLKQQRMDMLRHQMIISKVRRHRALELLCLDPTLSMLCDAPISCPAKLRTATKVRCTKINTVKERPTRGRHISTRPRCNDKTAVGGATYKLIGPSPDLHEAVESLWQALTDSQQGCSTLFMHEFSDELARLVMLITAADGSNSEEIGGPTALTALFALEIGRNIASIRQQCMTFQERLVCDADESELIQVNEELVRHLRQPIFEVSKFETEYIDPVPATWKVMTLSISQDQKELRISRLRSGEKPFVLLVPLNRHSHLNDEELLTFTSGKQELIDIIALASISAHNVGNPSRKGTKSAWWKTRTALDSRLKDLLTNINETWLGGFRGLFADIYIAPKAFSYFSRSFDNILKRHLPSRNKAAKLKAESYVRLDSQVLELFIGLGLPSNEGELDEALVDLLGFVVDIISFHGERNAHDEIDYDAMILDMLDSMHHYHAAATKELRATQQLHTVLILDKHLHCFPWESLPCLQGLSVSRLPSLEALHARLTQQGQEQHIADTRENDALVIDRNDGAYVLNPAGDLTNTEKTFASLFSSLPATWSGTTRQIPSEEDIVANLESRSLYLYFGHGSGGQYIRSRTIRKLQKCAVSFLMGCSSGAVTEAGQFESYGTPLTYLQGGAPAVVGTLWDVTDKDIDRFSAKVLQRWGLFGISSGENRDCATSRSPGKQNTERIGSSNRSAASDMDKNRTKERVSLDTAVAEAREECFLRYLNGAAPVVYGVPLELR